MRTSPRTFAFVAACALLMGCGGGTTVTSSPEAPAIAVSPQPASVAVGSTTTFQAEATGNGLNTPTWSILSFGNTAVDAGTLSSSSGSSISFTAPSSPPVYGGANLSSQGMVSLQSAVESPFGSAIKVVTFSITAPTVTTSIAPTSARVALGSTQIFTGYAVGSIDNGATFQVNGVTGGTASTGLISNAPADEGLYTAPATMPATGDTVTITLVSQADPTKKSSAVITLH